MTPREFCQAGEAERVKLAVHGTMLAGAVACCVYNSASYYFRREKHNAINAIVYGMLVALEVVHVQHHYTDQRTDDAR